MTDRPLRPNADEGREPQFVTSRQGGRLLSLAALKERIADRFLEEYGDDSPALRAADTPAKRIRLVLEVTNYVIAVESILISNDERANLVSGIYSDLFGYGALDALFLDERVTTISIYGADRTSVRYGHGDLVDLKPQFEDTEHLRRVINRLIMDAGAELREDIPLIETGLQVGDRRAAINVIVPPYVPVISVDIRVHPKTAPTLDSLVETGFMTDEAADLIRRIAASKYGFTVVGEPESGKTTLLGALAAILPQTERMIAVERSGEMALPAYFERFMVKWETSDQAGISFGHQIEAALDHQPSVLLLDEVRADEPLSIAPLLMVAESPRQVWSVRGVPDAKRLQSALGMLARRSVLGGGEAPVHALYDRLPFVLTMARIKGRLQLFSIAEWQSRV
ncbi:MAG: Flp pilus assembly complex ATPase component TadA, partial [Anaerolinea sp.]|nr:Flp pilus assembly complex ATPase component TadA [Anaerolinea sp.]